MLAAIYPTKKALKNSIGKALIYTRGYQETSCFGSEYKSNGKFAVVGPSVHNRKWYATVTMQNDRIVEVRTMKADKNMEVKTIEADKKIYWKRESGLSQFWLINDIWVELPCIPYLAG
jgi:hypothetical protein